MNPTAQSVSPTKSVQYFMIGSVTKWHISKFMLVEEGFVVVLMRVNELLEDPNMTAGRFSAILMWRTNS